MKLSRKKIQAMIETDGLQRSVRVNNGGGGGGGAGVSEAWVDKNYVSIEFFNRLFTAYKAGATESDPDIAIEPNDTESIIKNIKAKSGLWTDQFMSALGQNSGSGGGGGGATRLDALSDVAISNPTNGQVLKYNSTTGKWYNGTDSGVSSVAWGDITGKPSTLAGYNISDAYISSGTVYLGGSSLSPLLLSGGTMTGDISVKNKYNFAGDPSGYDYGGLYRNSQITSSGEATTLWLYSYNAIKIQGSSVLINGYTPITSGNIGSQSVSYATTADYAFRSTNLYADNSPYRWGDAAPYYAHLTYNTNSDNRWYLRVSPESPKTIAVDYAYNAGNAATATKLQTARTIWGQSFDGTGNVTGSLTGVSSISMSGGISISNSSWITISVERTGVGDGNLGGIDGNGMYFYHRVSGGSSSYMYLKGGVGLSVSGSINSTTDAHFCTTSGNVGIGTTSPSYKLDVSGDVQATNFRGALVGNASTATTLQTSRTLWGQSFNGSANVTGNMTDVGNLEMTGWLTIWNSSSKNYDIGLGWRNLSNEPYVNLYAYENNQFYNILIGDTSGSNGLVYDSSAGNWGIGTLSPSYKLDVNGVGRVSGYMLFKNYNDNGDAGFCGRGSSTNNQISLEAYSGNALGLGANGTHNILYINTSSNVGIGTTSPSVKLHVAGSLYVIDDNSNTGNDSLVYFRNYSSMDWGVIIDKNNTYDYGLQIKTKGSYGLLVMGGSRLVGSVKIGTSGAPSYALDVAGDIYATGAVSCLSDERFKTIKGETTLTVDQIAKMPSIKYKWNDGREDKDVHVGSIAQRWMEVLPEVVLKANDEVGTLSINYGVAAMIASITTARKVVDHERRIKELEKENMRLRTEIQQLTMKGA